MTAPIHTHPLLKAAGLIIFDKDGTLLDFHAMWGRWIHEVAARLEHASGTVLAPRLFDSIGFDAQSGKVAPGGKLATATMPELRDQAAAVLREAGIAEIHVSAVIAAAWFIPDPVTYARPLVDVSSLFGMFRARGCKIAIVTIDDRDPTTATLTALGVAPLVDALACADDGHPLKPAPDAVLRVCHHLDVPPQATIVVGDTASDLRMGRAAGVGMVIGVRSGIGTDTILTPLADLIIDSVAALHQ